MPDNLNLTAFVPKQSFLARFAIYIRVIYEAEDAVKKISLRLIVPGMAAPLDLGYVDDIILDSVKSDVNRTLAPLSTVVLRIDMSPFTVQELGWLKAIVTVDDVDYLAGAIRFTVGETVSPSPEVTRQEVHRF